MADEWGTPDEQDWGYDTEGYSPDDLGGGDHVDKEGWYHLEISEVVPELDIVTNSGKSKAPAIRFDLTVMHSVDGQSPEGSKHFHRIYLAKRGGEPPAEGSVKSAFRFGIGTGLLEVVDRDGRELIVCKDTGDTHLPASMWNALKGHHIVAKIAYRKGEGNYKDSYEIPFGRVYDPRDPKVADVPKNTEALALVGIKLPAKGQQAKPAKSGKKGTAVASAPDAPASKPPEDDDDLSDL